MTTAAHLKLMPPKKEDFKARLHLRIYGHNSNLDHHQPFYCRVQILLTCNDNWLHHIKRAQDRRPFACKY